MVCVAMVSYQLTPETNANMWFTMNVGIVVSRNLLTSHIPFVLAECLVNCLCLYALVEPLVDAITVSYVMVVPNTV